MQAGWRIGKYFRDWRSGGPAYGGRGVAASSALDGGEREETNGLPAGDDQFVPGTVPQQVNGVEEMEDERLQVLRMLEEHKITAEEAVKLLAALDAQPKTVEPPTGGRTRWLRIRATDTMTGKTKVNVNIPISAVLGLGRLGIRLGLGQVAEKEGVDLEEIMQAIRTGAEGKIVDVVPADGGDHVEIYVE